MPDYLSREELGAGLSLYSATTDGQGDSEELRTYYEDVACANYHQALTTALHYLEERDEARAECDEFVARAEALQEAAEAENERLREALGDKDKLLESARSLLCWSCTYWMPGAPGLCQRSGGYLACECGKLRNAIQPMAPCSLAALQGGAE